MDQNEEEIDHQNRVPLALTIRSHVTTSEGSNQSVKMFSVQCLRMLVRERLAATAAEITEFEQIIDQNEEEIDHQRRLLNTCWWPQIKIHRIDFPQQPDCKEEVLIDQQLWNQERISGLEQQELEPPQMKEQQEPEPPRVKEEEEELFISLEGGQPVVKLEADTFMVTPICEENEQREAEPNSEQVLFHNSAVTEIQDEEGNRHVDSKSIKEEEEEPKPKKRQLKTRSHSTSDDDCLTSKTLCENKTEAPQLHDCKEEEVLTVQQLWNQESNSRLGQEEQDAAQVKEEEEELSASQEEDDFRLKQEADTFMVTPTDEDNDNNETEPNSEQLLSHTSPVTESQDQGAGKNVNPGSSKREEPKKRLHRNRSDSNDVENSPMLENRCETCGHSFTERGSLKTHMRIHTGEKPFSCETCGQSFTRRDSLTTHMRLHTARGAGSTTLANVTAPGVCAWS
ncbi:uncharacterized protein KZ484_011717 [Pholidichthys leucotaenia]